MSKKKIALIDQLSVLFDRKKPKGAKGHAAIKRDRKLALRKVGIKP